jgi:hypothetical protein
MTSRTLTLHYGRELILGTVQAHTPQLLTPQGADVWATHQLQQHQPREVPAPPLSVWLPIPETTGSRTVVGVEHGLRYALYGYQDGWRLIVIHARHPRVEHIESLGEARAWAAGILSRNEGLATPRWQPGPAPSPDHTALYALI